MEGNQIWLAVLSVFMAVFLILTVTAPKALTEEDISKLVADEVSKIDINVAVPTAEEIAALVVIPEVKDVDNEKLASLYEKEYALEIEELEAAGLACFESEFDEEAIEELFESEIVGFDKIKSIKELEDETEIEWLNLGLKDDEDKKVSVYKEFMVKYETMDSTTVLKKIVVAETIVTYDDKKGFVCEIEYSFK